MKSSVRVLVAIKRVSRSGDGDTVVRECWTHEVPLLREIHASVNVVEPDNVEFDHSHLHLGERFTCESVEDEWARLEGVYGMHPEVKMSVVEKVYGSSMRLEEHLGDWKAEPVEDEFETMSNGELRKWLGDRGVETTPTWTGRTLRAKARSVTGMKEAA